MAKTASTKFSVKLPTEAVRPLYAAAGATDLAVEIARGYVSEAQVKVTHVDFEPKALQTKAITLVNASVDGLSKEARALPAKVEAYVNDTLADLNGTYAELAARGEKLVTRIRRQQATQDAKASANTTVAKAKSTRTSASKGASATTTSAKGTATTAKKAVKATRSNVRATGTAAKKTAAGTADATTTAAQKVGD